MQPVALAINRSNIRSMIFLVFEAHLAKQYKGSKRIFPEKQCEFSKPNSLYKRKVSLPGNKKLEKGSKTRQISMKNLEQVKLIELCGKTDFFRKKIKQVVKNQFVQELVRSNLELPIGSDPAHLSNRRAQ